jgi:hypothetical protein
VGAPDHSGELLDEAIMRVADEQRAGLAVVGPPQDGRPSSWLNVPTAIALAAAGDVPVVVLPDATDSTPAAGASGYDRQDPTATSAPPPRRS